MPRERSGGSAARPRPGEGTGLARDLRRVLSGEVDFSTSARALFASDASNYRVVPLGVVFPRDAEDVVAALAVVATGRPALIEIMAKNETHLSRPPFTSTPEASRA